MVNGFNMNFNKIINNFLYINKYFKLTIALGVFIAIVLYFFKEKGNFDLKSNFLLLIYYIFMFLETYFSTNIYKKTKNVLKTHQFIFTEVILAFVILLGLFSYIFFNNSSLNYNWIISLLCTGINAGIFSLNTGIQIEFTRGGVWKKKY